ncbi:hypothetical protein [Streptomyces tendae]|nr:hypothetical protein [Streptomyces tendae]
MAPHLDRRQYQLIRDGRGTLFKVAPALIEGSPTVTGQPSRGPG